ncbi:MAG: S16 family serine protease [Nanoarchaeota archaeon]
MKRKKRNKFHVYVLTFLLGFLLAVLIFYKPSEIKENEIKEVEKSGISLPINTTLLKSTTNVIAVDQNRQGLLGKVEVEITQGNGKILINTNPFLEPDTQFSANIAALVASNITGINLEDKNIIYDFDINGTVVGGPSAGASMTLATIAALQNKQLKNIGITGTILPNGEIGQVGAVIEKGEAVANNNLELYLIPAGETIFRYYEPQTTKRKVGNLVITSTRFVPKEINVIEYFEKEYGLKVIGVNNIQEAMKYAF